MKRLAWAALALAATGALAYAALSHRLYSETLPSALIARAARDPAQQAGMQTLLRKLYSLAGFALCGLLVDRALPATRRPALRAALVVAGFSALIEVAQKLHDAEEGPLSNAIDVACGALGGWLAVALPRALRRRA